MRYLKPALLSLIVVAFGCGKSDEDDSTVEPPRLISGHSGQNSLKETRFPVPGHDAVGMYVVPPKGGKNLHRAVLLIHGGGWVGGNKVQMMSIADALALEGFTGIPVGYELAAKGKRWPLQLLDVQAAVRYVRANAKTLDIDPNEIASAGISAGGHLSMFLGVTDAPVGGVSSKVQAVGSISGIHDLNLKLTRPGEQYHIVEQLLSDDANPSAEQKKQASPLTFASATSAPTYFIQGLQDPLVPPDQSKSAYDKLKSLNVETKMVMVQGMQHGLEPGIPGQKNALADFATWLKVQLKAK